MPRVNISFRVKPCHYEAIQEEIRSGKTLTVVFEELLDERFPLSGFSRG